MKTQHLSEAVFSQEAIDVLTYMIHDKGHVINAGVRNPALDVVIHKHQQRSPTLYRGMYEKDVETLASNEPFKKYLSASENLATAERFGTRVIRINPNFAFCYWKWVVNHYTAMKRNNFKMFRDVDGEFLIKSAKKEKEWIFAFGTILRLKKNGTYFVANL
jgi:hypothetical protein